MKPTLIFLSTLALVISVTTGFTVTSRTGSKQQYIASRSLHIIAKWNHNGQSRPAIILLRATTREEGSTTKATTATWTQKELDVFANKEGIDLSMTTLGPAFRAVARSTTNSSQILGYGEGFVRPAGEILHLDKMEVFKKMVDQVKTENDDFRGGGTTFGVGLLFGYQCLLHGTYSSFCFCCCCKHFILCRSSFSLVDPHERPTNT